MNIIAGNFKANLTRTQVANYTTTLENKLEKIHRHKNTSRVYLFPSHTALLDNGFKHFQLGAQNGYFANNGGFTGEIGLTQLQEFHLSSILIGHSERRTLFGEMQNFITQKFRFYAEAGFEIFYCIGENLNVRQQGEKTLAKFLESQLKAIDASYSKLVVAYEPIWAIGTGVSATLEQIASTHSMLSHLTSAPLLYGGSVNESNAKDILALDSVNGVLVGSASLDVEKFTLIIQAGLS